VGVTESVAWLERYSAVILQVLVVAERSVPLPAVPALLVVGALAAQGVSASCW
jgi:membrane protein DedA with SNARE-associated domain